MDTDSNNDGTIDHATDHPVADQLPGRCLEVYSGDASQLAEVDISPPGVSGSEATGLTGTITFSGDIHVWADTNCTQEITNGQSYNLATDTPPGEVYIEGENPGESSLTWTIAVGSREVPKSGDTIPVIDETGGKW